MSLTTVGGGFESLYASTMLFSMRMQLTSLHTLCLTIHDTQSWFAEEVCGELGMSMQLRQLCLDLHNTEVSNNLFWPLSPPCFAGWHLDGAWLLFTLVSHQHCLVALLQAHAHTYQAHLRA
jgi:hypothetical protein